MSDDQFTKLFKYMHQEFSSLRGEMRGEFAEVHKHLDTLYGAIDTLNKRSETEEIERLAMANQLDRHHGWVKQLAKHTHTKLVPEL